MRSPPIRHDQTIRKVVVQAVAGSNPVAHPQRPCRLIVYMAATETTTIRVPTETRDQLNALATRRGEPAGEVVAKLVSAADEEAMLAEVAAGFEKLAADPDALAAYRAEGEELESGFDAPAPEW
jgi:hypothetical protein